MTTRPGQLSSGVWGQHTALIDWCEQNYHITPWLAEFWNTLSNIPFILMAAYGIYRVYQQRLPSSPRFAAAYGGMGLVGLGSFLFHATLQYTFQLCDELPMIWFTSFLMWSSFESAPGFVPSKRSLLLLALTFAADAVLTVLYMYFPDPLYHQIIFGLLLITVTSRIAYLISSNPLLSPKPLVRSSPHSLSSPSSPSQLPSTTIASNSPREDDHIGSIYKTRITRLYSSGAITFVAGFVAWNLDNETCHLTEGWKASMGQPWSVVLEGHAWWHLLTGLGVFRMLSASTYLFCIIKTYQPDSPSPSPSSSAESSPTRSPPSSTLRSLDHHPEDPKPSDFELVSSFGGLLPYVVYKPLRGKAE